MKFRGIIPHTRQYVREPPSKFSASGSTSRATFDIRHRELANQVACSLLVIHTRTSSTDSGTHIALSARSETRHFVIFTVNPSSRSSNGLYALCQVWPSQAACTTTVGHGTDEVYGAHPPSSACALSNRTGGAPCIPISQL